MKLASGSLNHVISLDIFVMNCFIIIFLTTDGQNLKEMERTSFESLLERASKTEWGLYCTHEQLKF
jgi:hypothetical protein